MKLKRVVIENFRAYRPRTWINFEDLTTFVGKNDAGKSSILEALEIFFNQDVIKIERADVSVGNDIYDIRIGCVFRDAADRNLVIDESATTTLREEHLLNAEGDLEIHKIFDCSGGKPKESVCAVALHPTNAGMEDLLSLKNSDLK